MSMVDGNCIQIRPSPRPTRHEVASRARLAVGEATRVRNRRWLEVQRAFGFGTEDLARFLSQPARTVRRGLASARAEEVMAEAGGPDGLTEGDIAELEATFLGPDAEDPCQPGAKLSAESREEVIRFFLALRAGDAR